MTSLNKLTYVINKLQKENYPELYCYHLYKDSEYVATITKENEYNCLVYNDYMDKFPNKYYTKINEVKVLEPLSDSFVIVFSEDVIYFITF